MCDSTPTHPTTPQNTTFTNDNNKQEMGLTADQYLVRLRDPKEWGGGLEIVALANALQRPIFLYELKPVGILFWSK